MPNCLICGKEIPIDSQSHCCKECQYESQKVSDIPSTPEEMRRRQEHFGKASLNENRPPVGYGNMND